MSTTVRTAPGAAAAGRAAIGVAVFAALAVVMPGLGAGVPPPPGRGGLVAVGRATVEEAGFAPPAGVGRGGREIRIVSFLRSPGGFANPGIAGTGGGPPAGTGIGGPGGFGKGGVPGVAGTPGIAGFAGGAKRMVSFLTPAGGAGGVNGFGAGARRAVSFLTPGGGGVRPVGLINGAPGGAGGLGKGVGPETPGGLGGVGGSGTPSAI